MSELEGTSFLSLQVVNVTQCISREDSAKYLYQGVISCFADHCGCAVSCHACFGRQRHQVDLQSNQPAGSAFIAIYTARGQGITWGFAECPEGCFFNREEDGTHH